MNELNLFKQYNNDYTTKLNTPDWISNLARTALNKNITIDVWNAAVDDIRKIASDSVAVNTFINSLDKAFNDGTLAKILNVEKADGHISIQDWFAKHDELFPDIKRITYVPEEGTKRIPIEYVQAGYSWGDTSDIVTNLSDGDTTTAAFNPKYDDEAEGGKQVNGLVVYIESQFVSRILIYTSRYQQTQNPNRDTAKYGIMIDGNSLDDYNSAVINGVYNPHIVVVNKVMSELDIYVDIEKEDDGCLPIYEIVFLSEDYGGYYQINMTNGDTFRIDTYDLNKILTTLNALTDRLSQRIDDITANDNQAGGYARVGSDGTLPTKLIPKIITIDNFNIIFDNGITPTEALISEALTTAFPEAQLGDYANIVEEIQIPSIENPDKTVTEQVVRRTYILLGDDPTVRTNWKLKVSDYAYKASHAESADNATSADSIKGVDVTIGDINAYNASTKSGLFVITNYSTDEEI